MIYTGAQCYSFSIFMFENVHNKMLAVMSYIFIKYFWKKNVYTTQA